MRRGLLVMGIAVVIGMSQDWVARACDRASTAALTEDARLAIDVRCRRGDERAVRKCRSTLKKLFLAGSLDPDKTLRTYCDSVKHSPWGGIRRAPPALCVRRYGGWPEG